MLKLEACPPETLRERLIERVAQKHFGGDRSQVDSKAKDIFGRLSLKNYGEDVLKSYKQNFQGC